MGPPPLARVVEELLARAPALLPYARAFARVLPAATLVPAFAVRGLPGPVRPLLALALAAPLAGGFSSEASGSVPWLLLGEAVQGIPLAIALATPLWMAAHVGAIADALRGAPEATQAAPAQADGARGPLATLSATLAAAAFLASGATTRALLLLARAETSPHVAAWARAARALTDGLRVSVLLSAGVLVPMATLEVGLAVIGRGAQPLSSQPLAVLTRPLVAVVALAATLELAVRALVR